MNILYHEGKPYVTDKETFPTKPEICPKESLCLHSDCTCEVLQKGYQKAVADFIRDCTPIREEDQEKVLMQLLDNIHKQTGLEDFEVVDHTIYKVEGLELKEVDQWRWLHGDSQKTWFDDLSGGYNFTDGIQREYRRAFRVVETKTN